MLRNEALMTCAVCKKSIAVGEGHFRLADSRIHVKCYEKKPPAKKRESPPPPDRKDIANR